MADTLFGNAVGTLVGLGDQVGDAITETLGNTGQLAGPMRGAYLEYEVPMGPEGGKIRLLMKEPIGNWFGLKPKIPVFRQFEGKGTNKGKKYTARAGFREKGFKILLVPETQILVPRAKAADQRSKGGNAQVRNERVANFQIGTSGTVTVRQMIRFLVSSNRNKSIIGVISPTNRKYQWGGVMSHASDGGYLVDAGAAVLEQASRALDAIF